MPPHPASLPPDELLKSCTERHVRRSGPGGQNRNKVETGVVLTHGPTGLLAEANERRSQAQTRVVALRRLRRTLAVETRTPVADGQPSPLWRSRIRGGRIALSEEHDDHPTMIAEALDRLAAADWDVATAAAALAVTSSQLVKLLKTEPRAMQRLNVERGARDLPPLR